MLPLLLACVVCGLALFYVYLTWNYGYWTKMGVTSLEPSLIFGNIKDFVLMKKIKGLVYHDLYQKGSEPVLGIYNMRQPQWLIRNPDLLKMISTNEFANFQKNDVYTEESDFFFSTNVFFMTGEKWKKKRGIITPALTSSKLKLFVPYMAEIAKEMTEFLEKNQNTPFEAKSFSQLFTLETAMSYVYGVRCNSFQNPDSEFKRVFMEIFDPNWWNGFTFAVASAFPVIGRLFKIGLTPKTFVKFYLKVVEEAVELKKKGDMKKKDFLQYCIDTSGKDGVQELSIQDMTGLTMNIAADGTETTSAALASVIDALIRYPEHQVKLREEIVKKIKSEEDITYDNINDIPYLDAFITESLRILTPVPLIEKLCTSDCVIEFEGRKYKFSRGDSVAFPFYSIHMDSAYYSNPTSFDPERFTKHESENLPFFTFGSGPRMCLGRRLAYIQMKVFLCSILSRFTLSPRGGEPSPLVFTPNSTFFLSINGGVWFTATKIQ